MNESWECTPRALVPFGWRDFAAKYRLLLQEDGPSVRLAGEFLARLALWGTSQTTWLFDNALAPGWTHAPIAAPIFIIGHQRSGTTLMHRLLASDRTHARALSLQEMLLPAISFQRGLDFAVALDRYLGGHAVRLLHGWQDKRLGPMDAIHRLRLHEIEEDEFVFWAIFASAMCVNDAPALAGNPALDDLRHFDAWPVHRQQVVLGWYRACLMKKLYREPSQDGSAWIVAKNPAFSQKVPALRRVFPDARFVHLHRDPMETIPSRLSLIRAIGRQRFGADLELSPAHIEHIVADSIQTYARAHHDLKNIPPSDQITIPYPDFMADVPATIRNIYEHFQLPANDPALNEALAQHASTDTEPRRRHHYTLEEFGLTAKSIQDRLNNAISTQTSDG